MLISTILSGQKKFRVHISTVILDKLNMYLVKDLNFTYGFLSYLKSITEIEIIGMVKNLGKIFPDDFDCEIFLEEIILFFRINL